MNILGCLTVMVIFIIIISIFSVRHIKNAPYHSHMSVEELTKKAIAEIKKLPTVENVIDNAVIFADNVLKRLIAHTIGEDVDYIFKNCVQTRGALMMVMNDQKYLMDMAIVDRDYVLDLGAFAEVREVQDKVMFLLNTVQTLYCPMREYMVKRGVLSTKEYSYILHMENNSTLHLDGNSAKRIGVVLKKVNT